MAAPKKADTSGGEISIQQIERGSITFCVLGTTPFICNRMSQKVWFELLAPKGRKTAADKAQSLKHDPLKEFRDSPYFLTDTSAAPTLLGVMSSAVKRAMLTAALRSAGVNKTEIAQLVYVPGELLPIYGVPRVFMAITRSADMNKTPDVRTRAILPEWACQVSVQFCKPTLREQSIANLLSAAGFMAGIGDWRQEKGSGAYGSFKIVGADDPDFLRITTEMGRSAQQQALDYPVAYNDETSEMLAWFDVEIKRRGFTLAPNAALWAPASTDAAPAAAAAPAKKTRAPRKPKANGRFSDETVLGRYEGA